MWLLAESIRDDREREVRRMIEPRANTSGLWDSLWLSAPPRIRELVYSVFKEERGSVWKQMQAEVGTAGMDFKGLDVIEIGAGSGTFAAIFARRGANVTVLDYSENALDASRRLFADLGVDARFVQADALSLDPSLLGRFDVSMSFGLAEHFVGEDRRRIVKSHFDLLRPGGLAFVSVPNRHCMPYRLWKAKRELLGRWNFGLEVPFSRSELRTIAAQVGARDCRFIGSSFIASFDFLLPFRRWKNSYLKRFRKDRWLNPEYLPERSPGPLDEYFGYSLTLAARSSDGSA
jgi:2-polyprenyl-3-methyl-5-hydroxy-6-metoxy-1,4-benzoquinol methylase